MTAELATTSHLATAAFGRIQTFVWPLAQRPLNPSGRPAVLHAKCALADVDLLFISRAASVRFALEMNIELGTLIRGGPMPGKVRRHFDAPIAEGRLVEA